MQRPAQPRLYLLLTFLAIGTYLAVWLSHFQNVYGWLNDDFAVFQKALHTLKSPAGAFEGYNALHSYFFLISYLPLKLGISLPSHPLPFLGSETGRFRFFLLSFVFFHALALLAWNWFATRLSGDPRAAFFSTLLFLTSPTLALWTPQPDSRLVGFPLILAGAWLLLSENPPTWLKIPGLGPNQLFFVVGSLWGIAQSLHYTSLYIVAPLSAIYWARRLWTQRRGIRNYAIELGSFAIGFLWILVVFEVLGHFKLHIPFNNGVFATLMNLRTQHASAWTWAGNLGLWGEWFQSQMGWPLLLASGYGWWMLIRGRSAAQNFSAASITTIAWSVPLALFYVCCSGSQAMFRQTSVIQPFLFLFAAIGISDVSRHLSLREKYRAALAMVLLIAVDLGPARQAAAVFEAHQGLGRALKWVDQHEGDRKVYWLGVHWIDDPVSIQTLQELVDAPAGSWLITYAPWTFFTKHAALRPYFEQVQPLAQWPTLYSTDTLDAEVRARGNNDFRADSMFAYARVFNISDVIDAMHGRILNVKSVVADSVSSPAAEAANVFDGDSSPDGATAWVSDPRTHPHTLAIEFRQPVLLGDMQVAASPTDRSTSRISQLDIVGQDVGGSSVVLWTGASLEKYPVIRPRWAPMVLQGLKLVIKQQTEPYAECPQARIEEIVFPGYRVVGVRPQRAFPSANQ